MKNLCKTLFTMFTSYKLKTSWNII